MKKPYISPYKVLAEHQIACKMWLHELGGDPFEDSLVLINFTTQLIN